MLKAIVTTVEGLAHIFMYIIAKSLLVTLKAIKYLEVASKIPLSVTIKAMLKDLEEARKD